MYIAELLTGKVAPICTLTTSIVHKCAFFITPCTVVRVTIYPIFIKLIEQKLSPCFNPYFIDNQSCKHLLDEYKM